MMPTNPRFNGKNHSQLPDLISDTMYLKDLPQTSDAPTGYGNVAAVVNGLVDLSGVGQIVKPEVLRFFSDTTGVTITNISGNTSTTSIDNNSPFGGPALKVSLIGSTGSIEIGLTGLNLQRFDGNLVFKIWVDDYTKIGQFNLYAGTAGYGRLYQQNYALSSEGRLYNGNRSFAVGELHKQQTSTFVTGVDTLSDVKVRINTTADTTVWIESILLPRKNKAIVMFTYDDGFDEWASHVIPKLNEYSFKGAFAIQQNLINTPNYLTSEQLKEFAAQGHLLVPHQVTNTPFNDNGTTGQTLAQYMTDYTTSINSLRGWTETLGSSSYFAYVQGRFNQSLIDAIKGRGLRVARGVVNSYDYYSCGMGAELFAMKTAYMDAVSPTAQSLKDRIDNAIKYSTLLVLMGHEFNNSGTVGPSNWPIEWHNEIVDYVAEKARNGDLVVVTPLELVSILENNGSL